MALIEDKITENGIVTYDKVAIAIQVLRDYEQMALAKTDSNGENGYYVCISGGKDSSVIQELLKKGGTYRRTPRARALSCHLDKVNGQL